MGGGAGRGKKGGPTGRRTFSRPDDIMAGTSTDPRWKARKDRNNEVEDSEEEESSSSEESGEAGANEEKSKGVQGLIEVSNPNAPQKAAMKASQADPNATSQLSRREREEIEKQRSKERYMKMQEQGKTEEAKKDLERLQLIRQQREEAAKKREEEKKAKEAKKLDARKK